jgi:hypothetical protein
MDLASANKANIVPADDHQREALKRGQNYTEWLGRYSAPVDHRQHHTRAAVDVGAFIAAYGRLFGRCVEEVARTKYLHLGCTADEAAAHAIQYRMLFECVADEVDPLPEGTIVPRIEVETYPGFVTRVTFRGG